MSIDSLTSIQFLSIQDSLVVGQSDLVNHYDVVNDRQKLPFSNRFTVSNMKMVNFDKPGCVSFGMLQYVSVENSYIKFRLLSYETSVGLR